MINKCNLMILSAIFQCYFANASSDLCESQRTVDLIECASSHYKNSDVKLNESYQKLLLKVPDKHKSVLRDGQRSWIKFRDEYCSTDKFNKVDLGDEAPIEHFSCLYDLTRSRVYEMQVILGGSDVFDVAIYKVSSHYSKLPVDEIIRGINTSGAGNKNFDEYAIKNCDLSYLLSSESKEYCLSRVYFFGKK